MKNCLLVSFFLLINSVAWAITQELPRLPEPVTADREVSHTFTLTPWQKEQTRLFRIEISFEATPSNSVQLALGRDTLSDGQALDATETDLCLGWDSGEWFLQPQGLRERYTVSSACDGSTTLRMDVRLSRDGSYLAPTFTDHKGLVVFDNLVLTPTPTWLKPEYWNSLRVTVRGAGLAQENIKAIFAPAATVIILK